MDIDTTKPNAGRIYDYLLGGHHNFEPNRIAADRLLQIMPEMPKWMRLNRWFMYHAVSQLANAQFQCYLDLATGLPTQGYLHERLPDSTRIVYNDIDPATVAYGRQIVASHPNIRYLQSDIRSIDYILAEADAFFQGTRRVGMCMVGVAYFIDDEALARVFHRLYEWAAPGSRPAVSFAVANTSNGDLESIKTMYQNMGSPVFMRSMEQIQQLIQPWQPTAEGFRQLSDYISGGASFDRTMTLGDMIGGVVVKPER